ncbi:hypothetical protein [Pectobacterium versatile]|nr:hypothetical protein [Pectobacterium versatile]
MDWDDMECRIAREESRHLAGVTATQPVIRELNQQEQREQA